MLGWFVCVYRQSDPTRPATNTPPKGALLARWQTHLYGLDWLDRLVQAGKVVLVADNNGYPLRYTGHARDLLPLLTDTPPNARAVWVADAGDILLSEWAGKTEIHPDEIAKCRPDEWLLVETWDES